MQGKSRFLLNAGRPVLLLVLLTLFTGCGPDLIFDQTHIVQNEKWAYSDSATFEVPIPDTGSVYNLYLDIEHSTDYPFQNLYLMIHTTFPSGKRLDQRLSVDLLTKSGLLLGDCSGNECDLRVRLQEGAYFNESGNYRFAIEQFTRRDSLQGIRGLSLRIEDTGQDVPGASAGN